MRILVVEDESTMAESLRVGLTDEGFAVDVAADGAEGLWYAAEVDYDAIVLDLMLPRIDGGSDGEPTRAWASNCSNIRSRRSSRVVFIVPLNTIRSTSSSSKGADPSHNLA